MATLKLPQSFSKVSAKFLYPRAYILSRAEDIEIDKEIDKDIKKKETKKKECVAGGNRHASFNEKYHILSPVLHTSLFCREMGGVSIGYSYLCAEIKIS